MSDHGAGPTPEALVTGGAPGSWEGTGGAPVPQGEGNRVSRDVAARRRPEPCPGPHSPVAPGPPLQAEHTRLPPPGPHLRAGNALRQRLRKNLPVTEPAPPRPSPAQPCPVPAAPGGYEQAAARGARLHGSSARFPGDSARGRGAERRPPAAAAPSAGGRSPLLFAREARTPMARREAGAHSGRGDF